MGREPRTQEVGRYYREPAQVIPPCLVPYAIAQRDPGVSVLDQALSATLLDFARRGAVRISPGYRVSGEEVRFELLAPPEGASGVELELWRLFETAAGRDRVLRSDELREHFRRNPGLASLLSSRLRLFYQDHYGRLLDPNSEHIAAYWGERVVRLGFLLVLLALPLWGFWFVVQGFLQMLAAILPGKVGSLAWVSPVLLGILSGGLGALLLGAVGASALLRWEPEALLQAKRWWAYRNFLADFSQMETAPPEHFKLWDYHLVYAAALGVARRYLRNLARLAQQRPELATVWRSSSYTRLNKAFIQTDSLGSFFRLRGGLELLARNLKGLEQALKPFGSGPGGGFGGSSRGGSSGGGGSSGAR